MNERTYRRVFEQFLNDYWGAFHEVLEAQSVNPKKLAGSLFDAVIAAHSRFATVAEGDPAVIEHLDRLWHQVLARRAATPGAPLSAREVIYARAHFEAIYDALSARGKLYPLAAEAAHAEARHGTPRTALRPDAAA